MANNQIYGYAGKILRVDLTRGSSNPEVMDEAFLRKYVGGASMGIKMVYDEVAPGVEWSAPENRIFFGSGPLGGTRVQGSGGTAVVTKGPLTNGMASTQAMGFFGAYLRLSGFDAIICHGASPKWVYLYVHDGIAEIRDAGHLVGKNTYEVDAMLKQELQKKENELSTLCIGPAGENLVKFAGVFIDLGHAAAHNGPGAVMGSKKLKAIAVDRGKNAIAIKDSEALANAAKELLANAMADPMSGKTAKEGTVGGVSRGLGASVPVKNYTTHLFNIEPELLKTYSSESIRSKFKAKVSPCYACSALHCHMYEIQEGKYKGRVLEEPEYEAMAAFSILQGITDVTTTVVLANEVDLLGLDVNETGWVISWLMECYEKRILTKKDTDGIEMTWGNGEAVMAMLNKIARREGFGNILAEGVMRAAQKVGGEAPKLAIHSKKGNTPRTHDHRALMRFEMFDTCVSNLGTIEASTRAPYKLLGIPPTFDNFDPMAVSTTVAKVKGATVFEDSMVTCRTRTAVAIDLLCNAVNAATGWNVDFAEAMAIGRRGINLGRAFNLRHGIAPELDAPSMRYGSTPLDGVAAGKDIMCNWPKALANYYSLMGWDEKGKPTPQTLTSLGLESVVPQLWQ